MSKKVNDEVKNETSCVDCRDVRFKTHEYQVRATEDVVVNDRIVKKTVYKTVHSADKFKGLKASDFALENIIAVGAVDSLKDCKLGFNTVGETSDMIDPVVDNVISALNTAESQTPNNE